MAKLTGKDLLVVLASSFCLFPMSYAIFRSSKLTEESEFSSQSTNPQKFCSKNADSVVSHRYTVPVT